MEKGGKARLGGRKGHERCQTVWQNIYFFCQYWLD